MPSVNDYDVANASGAAVRSDLNNIFEAIQTCNSESAELDGTKCKKGMWFLHGNTLKICKSVVESGGTTTASFAVIGDITLSNCGLLNASGATMTGVFKIDDSTSHTTPALSFDGDEDLGLFRKDADQMGFACANAEQMIFDANGLTLQAGNDLRLADSDSTNYVALKAPATVGTNYTLTLPTETGSAGEFLKIESGGQLSFGTVTSTQALTVSGNLTVTGTVDGRDVAADGTKLDNLNKPLVNINLSASQTLSGNNTHTLIQFNTEISDANNCFDTSTHKFTPNVAGFYFVSLTAFLGQDSGTGDIFDTEISVCKNTADSDISDVDGNDTVIARAKTNPTNTNPDQNSSNSLSTIVQMNGSSDFLIFRAKINSGSGVTRKVMGSNTNPSTFFIAYRLQA